MKNWKQIAAGYALPIPEEQLARISPSLDSLDAAFRPLLDRIPLETEPAIILSFDAVSPK